MTVDTTAETYAPIEPLSPAGGLNRIPFYLVCDESGSMSGAPINAVNDGLKGLFREISANPITDDKALVSVIAFQNHAEILVPLQPTSLSPSFPSCTAEGGTSYKAAFASLRSAIDSDCGRIRGEGHALGRPVVFFMSDGRPNTENWQSVHSDLVSFDNKYRPHIISFGVGDADKDVIWSVATDVARADSTRFAYMAKDGISPGDAIKEIMKFVTGTIINSAKEDEVIVNPLPPTSGVMRIDPLP